MMWALERENLSLVFVNNKGADQPAHPRSLISTFVILLLECIISKLATCKISIFWLVCVAEETGLSLILSETPKTGFCRNLAHILVLVAYVTRKAQTSFYTASLEPSLLTHTKWGYDEGSGQN